MTDRAEQLIDALAKAIMPSIETMAERLDLSPQVARIQQRMSDSGSASDSKPESTNNEG